MQTGDPVRDDARSEIDHIDAVVAKLGDQQPLAGEIDCHVVDAATDIVQRNRPFQHQRRVRGMRRQ